MAQEEAPVVQEGISTPTASVEGGGDPFSGLAPEGSNPSSQVSAEGENPNGSQQPQPEAIPFDDPQSQEAATPTLEGTSEGAPEEAPQEVKDQAPPPPEFEETTQEGPRDMLVERWFGQQGFFHNLIKTNTKLQAEFNEQATAVADAVIEEDAVKEYKDFFGEVPQDQIAGIVEKYKQGHQEKYNDLLAQQKEKLISDKIAQIQSGSVDEAIKTLIDDPEIQAQTMQIITDMLKNNMGVLEEGEEEEEGEEATGNNKTVNTVKAVKREEISRKKKFYLALNNMGGETVASSNFGDFAAALLGSYESVRDSYNGKLGENRETLSKFGVLEFDEKAQEAAESVGITSASSDSELKKYGYNALIVKMVQKADREDPYKTLMTNLGVDLNAGYLKGVRDLSDQDLQNLPNDRVLQDRINGFFQMINTACTAQKAAEIDTLFKDTFIDLEIKHDNNLGITLDLIEHLQAVGQSPVGYKKAFE